MEGIFTLGLDGCIEVLQESKTDEDRAGRGKTVHKSQGRGRQGSTVQGKGWEPRTQIWVQSPIFLPTVPSQASDFLKHFCLWGETFFKLHSALQFSKVSYT